MRASKYVMGAVVLLASGVAVAATDTKVFHGTICRAQTDNSVQAIDFGAFCSSSTGCFAVCPLVRDYINDKDTFDTMTVEGEVSTFSSGMTCSAIAQSEDISGSILNIENKSVSGAGPKQMVFNALDASAGDEGAYLMTCSMGRSDRIFHVSLRETTDLGGVN